MKPHLFLLIAGVAISTSALAVDPPQKPPTAADRQESDVSAAIRIYEAAVRTLCTITEDWNTKVADRSTPREAIAERNRDIKRLATEVDKQRKVVKDQISVAANTLTELRTQLGVTDADPERADATLSTPNAKLSEPSITRYTETKSQYLQLALRYQATLARTPKPQ